MPGNHESSDQIAMFCGDHGFRNFHGQIFEMNGWHFAGLGYSNRTPFSTPGEFSEDQIAERLAKFAGLSPMVLVCHAPPLDTDLDGVKPGQHFGSQLAVAPRARTGAPSGSSLCASASSSGAIQRRGAGGSARPRDSWSSVTRCRS